MPYADRTRVEVETSRREIEQLVTKFGATSFMIALEHERKTAAVQFFCKERMIRLTLKLTDKPSEDKRLWRSLALLLKAKLVAIADGLVEFEQEFLPNIVMADGATVYERTREDLKLEYQKGSPQLFLTKSGAA